jgi:hypothetical protein
MVCLESHRGSHSSYHGLSTLHPYDDSLAQQGSGRLSSRCVVEKSYAPWANWYEYVWVLMRANGLLKMEFSRLLTALCSSQTSLTRHESWLQGYPTWWRIWRITTVGSGSLHDHRSESKNVEDRPVISIFLMLKRGCINMSIPINPWCCYIW